MQKALIVMTWGLGVLILAIVFDVIYQQMRQEAGSTFNFTPLILPGLGFRLVIAAAVLGLALFVLFYTERSIAISLVFIVTGAAVLPLMTLPLSIYILGAIPEAIKSLIQLDAAVTSPLGLTPMVGALMTIIGIIGLTPLGQHQHAGAS
jgi:hypothetical protein